jgi:RHS repeat-associated protein
MPLFPAAKFMDTVIGIDMHAVAPIPGIPIHPYVGPVYLWSTPVFPSINVFINDMPACSVGALGYCFHVPQGVPVPPTPTNSGYWKRYLVNVPMVLTLTGLTILANLAIAGISSLIPKPKSAENFIKDVTGIDTSSRAATWQTIQTMFAAYSKWQTWAKLLMPPLPYPGSQGSVAVGSPNVTVNGGALAFVGPLLATSCSDIPVVPNAATLGFSNVLVGVSFADLARGILVAATQRAIQTGLQKGLQAATRKDEEAEEQNNKCDDAGHPVSQATGAAWSTFTDINTGYFRLQRTMRSTWCDAGGTFGYGMRHDFQYTLSFDQDLAVLVDPDGGKHSFLRREDGRFGGSVFGWTLSDRGNGHYLLEHGSKGRLAFQCAPGERSARLVSRTLKGRHERFTYDSQGRCVGIGIRAVDTADDAGTAEIAYGYNDAGYVAVITGTEVGGTAVTLGTYTYDEQGCLIEFCDALGGCWKYAYDSARRCVRETNPNGYSFHYEYDAEGRCVRSAGDDGLWRVNLRYAPGRTLQTEADNGLWAYTIDEHRTITEIMDPYGGKRQRTPAPDGRVLVEIDSGGRAMHNLFDAAGRQLGRMDRWGNRWPTQDEAPKLPNPLAHKIPRTAIEREFGSMRAQGDAALRAVPPALMAAIEAAIPPRPREAPSERLDLLGRVTARSDANGAIELYQHDAAGNRVQRTDADGLVWRRDYASWNLRIAEIDSAGNLTRFRYTKREKIAAIIDAGGSESKYTYDCKDRLTHVFRHGVLREQYRYDTGDRLIEKLDGEGSALLKLDIGPNGLPAKRLLASGEEHSFAYSPYGDITEASTTRAKVLIRHVGRQRATDTRDGRGIEHRWAGDRLAATRYLDRFIVRYEELGPGDTLIHLPSGRPHRITLDTNGNVLRLLGSGTRELSRYDAVDRCIGRARWHDGATSPACWTSYRYSPGGELAAALDDTGAATMFHYDAAHRLIARDGPTCSMGYDYDAAGNLIATPACPSLTYTEGNRLDRAGETLFRYNSRNHLSEIQHADGRVERLHYDSMDLLIRIDGAVGCDIWEAEYDGLCRRTAKIVDGARTEYYWDGDRLAAEEAPDGRIRLYIYADAVALVPLGFIDYANAQSTSEQGKPYWVFYDQIGLPILIEDGGAHTVWRAAQVEPYGVITVAPGARVVYNLRFPGHCFDHETGLHCNRFRSYSPALGRYLQSDPAGQSGGVNLYAYAANPLAQVDVLGLTHKDKGAASTDEAAESAGSTKEHPDADDDEVTVTNSAGEEVTRNYVANQDELLASAEASAGGSMKGWEEYKPNWYRNEDDSRRIEWNPDGHENTDEGPHAKVMDYNPERDKHEVTSKTFIDGWDNYKRDWTKVDWDKEAAKPPPASPGSSTETDPSGGGTPPDSGGSK